MTTIANFTVEGPNGAGSTAGNPVAMGYTDGSGNVQAVSATSGLPVSPKSVTLTDRSLITLGTTATQVMAANTSRLTVELQNNNDPGGNSIWASFTTVTPTVGGAGCFQLPAGGASWTPPGGVIYTAALFAIGVSGTSILYAVEGQ